MQRLFSMFPGGAVGVALIVLRACVLGSLWVEALSRQSMAFVSWPFIGVSLVCIFIATGAFTPLACAACIAIELSTLWPSHAGEPFHILLAVSFTLVLALLGPGAFSIDARLFGRRRIIQRK
jgi:uncharacterized membrane protein YphA (DoxX/SURF4 family)